MAMSTLLRCCLCSLALLVPTTSVLGYQQPRRPQIQRREAFGRLVLGSGLAGLVQLGAGPTPPAHAIIGSKGCYQGQGEACTELAGENDLIKSLQEKSSANRAKNEKEARDAYYMKNYPDFFAASGKKMLKKPDGGFILVSDGELEELKKKNRLTYEIPRTMAGQVVDYTQKPIWVLKDE